MTLVVTETKNRTCICLLMLERMRKTLDGYVIFYVCTSCLMTIKTKLRKEKLNNLKNNNNNALIDYFT